MPLKHAGRNEEFRFLDKANSALSQNCNGLIIGRILALMSARNLSHRLAVAIFHRAERHGFDGPGLPRQTGKLVCLHP